MPPYSVVRVSPPLDVTIPGCAVLLSVLTLFCYIPQPRGAGVLPDCAVCYDGYGSGVSNSCHPCDDTKAHLLIAMGVLFCLVLLLLLFLAIVFLIGGLDAIDIVRQSVGRKFSVGSKASSTGPPVSETRSQERCRPLDVTVAPAYSFASEAKLGDGGGGEDAPGRTRVFPTTHSDSDDMDRTFTRALGPDVGTGAGVKLSDGMGRYPSRNPGMSADRQARLAAVSDSGVGGAQAIASEESDADGGEKPKGCGLGAKLKRYVSRLPLDKLKILVVVWQILAVFSSITGVEFPASYARFLSWISVVNLDIGSIFSASCVLPSVNFYTRLLVTTLAPLGLAAELVLTYQTAKARAGIGSAGVIARRTAWSRHVAAGLLLSFLVRFNVPECTAAYTRAEWSVDMRRENMAAVAYPGCKGTSRPDDLEHAGEITRRIWVSPWHFICAM